MDHLTQLGLAAGLAWASGLRLYAAIFVIGMLGRFGHLQLPDDLLLLQRDGVLVAAGVLLVGEFVADKIPWFDSAWDAVHTFVRIPAGALLAWGAADDMHAGTQFAVALMGGLVTSGTHLAKSGARAAINTSPEPLSNWTLSFGEDGLLLAGLYLAVAHPVVFLVLLGVFLALVAWLLPKLFRLAGRAYRRVRGDRASRKPPGAARERAPGIGDG